MRWFKTIVIPGLTRDPVPVFPREMPLLVEKPLLGPRIKSGDDIPFFARSHRLAASQGGLKPAPTRSAFASDAHIRPPDLVRRQQLSGRPARLNAADLDQVGAVDHAQHLLYV